MFNGKIICGDIIEELHKLSPDYFDLAIADPPYFKSVNQTWDYQWRTIDDYLSWCQNWIAQTYKVLRLGGTLYVFGNFRIIALLIPFLEETGFVVRQLITIDKGLKSVAGRATKNYKLFPNTTEHILFLVKDNIPTMRKFLLQRQKETGISAKQINEALGVKSNGGGMWSIYTGNNVCCQFPTKEIWDKLQSILYFQMDYNKVSQTFNPIMGFSNVWTDISFTSEKRYHPTQKPQKLIQRLITASSNINDNVLDLFSGSGSTYIASKQLNRIPTAIENNPDYIQVIQNRVLAELQ